MQRNKITGIIFKIVPHGEYDRVVVLFTEESGLTAVLAKGIRRARSRRSFSLDLLNEVVMEIEVSAAGQNSFPYLREISVLKHFAPLKKQPRSFASACLVVSFLLRILPRNSPQPELFRLFQEMLAALNRESKPGPVLFTFFLKAMRMLGHMPNEVSAKNARSLLLRALQTLDPQFTLQARRTLASLESLERTKSS